MFTRVKLKNFKCFQDTDVVFRNRRGTIKSRIILTGSNGSGKSSFITSFVFLKNLFDGYYISEIDLSKRRHNSGYFKPELSCPTLFRQIKPALTTGTTEVLYEFSLNNIEFGYKIEFSLTGNLIFEHLYRIRAGNEVTIFKANLNKKEFHHDFFKETIKEELTELALDIWGEYSLLGIVGYYFYQNIELFKEKIFHHRVYEVAYFLNHLQIESLEENFKQYQRLNLLHGTNFHPFKGTISTNGDERDYFNLIQPVLKEVLCWLIPSITDLDYEFINEEEEQAYQLYIWQKTSLGEIKMSISDASRGVRQLVRLCHLIFEGFQGFPIIMDDFDFGLHFFVKKEIYNLSLLGGLAQTIVTMHSTSVFEQVNSSAIYLARYENETYGITNLDDILPTQANHNNRVRYERGLFGKPEQNLNLRFGLLMREVAKQIKEKFYQL